MQRVNRTSSIALEQALCHSHYLRKKCVFQILANSEGSDQTAYQSLHCYYYYYYYYQYYYNYHITCSIIIIIIIFANTILSGY